MPKKARSNEELDDHVLALVREQFPLTAERAKRAQGRVAATWMATGDSLALLICDATGSASLSKIYRCRVLDCIVEKEI